MKPSIIEIAEEEFYNEENNRIMHSKDAEVDTFINDLYILQIDLYMVK